METWRSPYVVVNAEQEMPYTDKGRSSVSITASTKSRRSTALASRWVPGLRRTPVLAPLALLIVALCVAAAVGIVYYSGELHLLMLRAIHKQNLGSLEC